MAIKNTQMGGTDWVAESLTYTDLNDTFDEAHRRMKVHYDGYSYATNITHTGDTNWYNSGTENQMKLTLSHSANAILLGVNYQCDFVNDNAAQAQVRIYVVGSTLGTVYIDMFRIHDDASVASIAYGTSGEGYTFFTDSTTARTFAFSVSPCVILPDTSTEILVYIKVANSAHTCTLSDQVLKVAFVDAPADDTS